MEFRKTVFLAFFTLVFSLSAFADILQNEQYAETTRVLVNYFKENNVRSVPLDDAHSKKIFTMYLDTLDPEKQDFLAADIEAFKADETNLDDQMLKGDLSFPAKVIPVYQARVRERLSMVTELLRDNIDFTIHETLNVDYKNAPFAANAAEARERTRKEIKAQILLQKLDNPAKSLEACKATVLKNQTKFSEKVAALGEEAIVAEFLEAFARSFDPHSDYMPPASAETFSAGVTLQHGGIGTQIKTDEVEGHTIVAIMPGGPALTDGNLKVGDKLVSVSSDGTPANVKEAEPLSLEEVAGLLRGKPGTKVLVRYRRSGESEVREVTLTRAMVKNESMRAYGTVREMPGTDTSKKLRLGIIVLPTFYYDFEACRENPDTCLSANNDIRALLMSDEFKSIDGLILDLRTNTGGSLTAAIEIVGLFIHFGPVSVVKGPKSVRTLKDQDFRAYYTGPLVVAVNGMSASASEIVAAALQDNGRAIVVGANTFGKGTVQNYAAVASIEDRPRVKPENEPLGAFKLSVQEFFRINGDSTQGPGVIPNIKLPSLGAVYFQRESDEPNALSHTTTTPLKYGTYGYATKETVDKVAKKSTERRAKSAEFLKLEADIAVAISIRGRKEVLLHEGDRRAQVKNEPAPQVALKTELIPLVLSKTVRQKNGPVPDVDNYYNQEILFVTRDYVENFPR